ncbi:MAG TPA: DUF4340 domain-containing protein [Gemmatimonadales bacterium]|nr:DUF4340 domain-containing protein [Gemmatimonadales bacterium]
MRKFASTIVLVLVLAGLVGYIYFVDSKQDTSGASDKEKVFGSVTADEIEEIQVKSADGESSRLQKSDGKWQLVEPVKAAADEGEASSLASSLASLEVNRVVDENAAALAEYGLEPARLEVGFKKKGDANEQRVLIGEKTPTGGDLYARAKDSKRVFLIPAYLDASFNKNTFALRDRRILSFDRNAVDGLEVTSGSSKVQLTKTGSEWRLSSPIAARADFAAVEGALERLSSTQMQGIVDPEGGNLAKYGLTKPTGSIVVAAGSSRATLTLGSTDNSLLFARDGSRPMVFTVAPVLKDDVIRSVGDFRRKDLFDARAFTATRVELKRGADTVTLEKSKGEKGDVWRAAGKDVESGKADDLLTKLTGLRAQSYEAQAHSSLKKPALVVSISFDEKKQETVTFGRSEKDVFASRSDEPGAAKLEASGLDEVIKALDALK